MVKNIFLIFFTTLFIGNIALAQNPVDNVLLNKINKEIDNNKKYISKNSSLFDESNNNNVKSVVFLYQDNMSLIESIGSGVIINNNNILTAKHLTTKYCYSPIGVYNYMGEYIGDIKAKCEKDNERSVINQLQHDQIILPLTNINKNNLSNTLSAKLSKKTSAFQLTNIKNVIGFGFGISGSPVYNQNNEVVGIVSMMREKGDFIPIFTLMNQYKELRITNPVKNNITQLSNKALMGLLMKKMCLNVDLLIAPHTYTKEKEINTKVKDIIGFPNGIGIHYKINN